MSESFIVLQPKNESSLRKYALIVYILYVLSLFVGITSLIGVIIAYVKRNEAQDTIYYHHFQYLIRTFWGSVIGAVVGVILMLVAIGYFVLVLTSIWFIYRIVVGLIRFSDGHAVDAQSWF